MSDILDFLERFNEDELDVEKYFGSYEVWFKLLDKRGLLDQIDPQGDGSDSWQNHYILYLYENKKDEYYDLVQKFLGDIYVDPTTKKVYWEGDREDLATLFCDGNRYDVSQDTVKTILSDDGDWWEPYWETTDDVYRDVIEELNKENLTYLKGIILKELNGKKLTPETEEMELIAAEQGHDDYWEMTPENIDRIVDNEESMNNLLDNELTDMKSELYSLHSNSFNSAAQDGVWKEIWSELSKFFENSGEWISKPHPFKKDTIIQKFRIPINDFEGLLNDWLYNNAGYRNSTLEYHGSYIGILDEGQDCLSVRFPDSPDYRLVDKNLNSMFRDYL